MWGILSRPRRRGPAYNCTAGHREEPNMPDSERVIRPTATMEQRVDAIQAALDERGMNAADAVAEQAHRVQDEWVPRNGARVVAGAWVDPAFKARLLAGGRAAAAEPGLPVPKL